MANAGTLWVENIANVIMDSLENFDTLCVKIGPLWHAKSDVKSTKVYYLYTIGPTIGGTRLVNAIANL